MRFISILDQVNFSRQSDRKDCRNRLLIQFAEYLSTRLVVYPIFTLLELELFPNGVLNETKPYQLAVMKNSKQLEIIRRVKCYDPRYGASIQIPLDCMPFKQCGSNLLTT